MIKEFMLDLENYIVGGTVYKRKAVRGIIRHADRYLIIHGKYGDYKFPGGGIHGIIFVMLKIMQGNETLMIMKKNIIIR